MAFSAPWDITKQAFKEWWEANVSRMASSLAYYTVFSIAPLLVIATAIAGAVFGAEAARREVSAQLAGLFGPAAATLVEQAVQNAARNESSGAMATLLSVVLLVFGASNVFSALQDSLNTIWGVRPKPGLGVWNTIRIRLLSFGMVVGIGFLLLVSLIISAALSALSEYFSGGGAELWWQIANLLVSLAVFSLVFAMVYRFLPDVRIGWGEVWVGAAITAVLFSLGKTLIGLYLGHSSVASVYGAAGSLVVLLLWVYYSSQILFLGAEFTQAYARRRGRRIRVDPHAVPLTESERCQQGIPHEETVKAAVREAEKKPAGRATV